MTQPYLETNRARWNELTGIHARSAFYDVGAFKAGKCALRPLEVAEVGDVTSKSLLHLQCHFGLDTLSWARRGARVTGIDFSQEAVALATSLAQELGLPARFVCSDVYESPNGLSGQFDIVFTSYGAICWLPDLARWARVIAHFLKPGGTFYMAEIHPFAFVFDDRKEATELRVAYSYFYDKEPLAWQSVGTYADRNAEVSNTTSYVWNHGIGDVLNALVGAGLRLEFMHEFPYCVCGLLPFMEQSADGWWRLKEDDGKIPLLFSLKATNS